MSRRRRYSFVYGVPLGEGGLGVQAGNALRGLARAAEEVHAIGPGRHETWTAPKNIVWHVARESWTPALRLRPFRRYVGIAQQMRDRAFGTFAARCVEEIKPDLCYAFTQVAREPLEWANRHGLPAILESPNGHIRNFRSVYDRESARWCGSRYIGHPSTAMVKRVEAEYAVASHVRVSSQWAKCSLAAGGVAHERLVTFQQPIDTERYGLAERTAPQDGPLRICFVGSLDLRKGFVYLLRALRELSRPASVEFVGATGDRCCKELLAREREGLTVAIAPGDPRAALARAELFVLPTLEDGSPFAVAEAMASGVPVVTTSSTGASEWIRPGRSGWVVEPGSESALAAALEQALARRGELPDMGQAAREDTLQRIADGEEQFATWIASL